jgi:ribosomal protein L7/L12
MADRTLPIDGKARKQYSLDDGFEKYFPAAIALAARNSYIGGAKHTGGELVHKRWLSFDHGNCISRHKMDIASLETALKTGVTQVQMYVWDFDKKVEELKWIPTEEAILMEAGCLMWRAGAMVQELAEKYGGYPLAPAAILEPPVPPAPIVREVKVVHYRHEHKIAMIKAIRTLNGADLKTAKDLSEQNFPFIVPFDAKFTQHQAEALLREASASLATENL